ncbi:MAG: motility protein A [Oscillospiraceae bacterium]|jgi:chemotaxis protein MotA|nr:motility protein A [Oscillospiraceae bacterium]
MDITSIVGIIGGFGMIVFSIISSGGNIMAYIHVPSLVLVFGGTTTCILTTYPISYVGDIVKVLGKAFKAPKYDHHATIASIIDLANVARKEGLLALEEVAHNIPDPFTKKAVNLMVDGTDPVLLKDILEVEISSMESRHLRGAGVFENMSAFAPAVGMLGTVIGLIVMLGSLDDPSGLGPGMAVALITTFYGSIIANLIGIPLCAKLKQRSAEEIMQMELTLEGILSIHGGENPRIIEEKLLSFLSQTAIKKNGKPSDAKAAAKASAE